MESTINSSYKSLSDKKLFEKLKDVFFSGMKDAEKIELLQEIENREAVKVGRPAIEVSLMEAPPYELGCHAYEDGKEILRLNKNISGYQMLETLFHEGRHAFQVFEIEKEDSPDIDETVIIKWAMDHCGPTYRSGGFGGLISPDTSPETEEVNFILYEMQPIEMDARQYSRERMQEVCALMGNDLEIKDELDQQQARDVDLLMAAEALMNTAQLAADEMLKKKVFMECAWIDPALLNSFSYYGQIYEAIEEISAFKTKLQDMGLDEDYIQFRLAEEIDTNILPKIDMMNVREQYPDQPERIKLSPESADKADRSSESLRVKSF